MKLQQRINAFGISGALEYEEHRKRELLNYLLESQSLISKINTNWTDGMKLNRYRYDRLMQAVADQRRDCNATATVIRNLRQLQEKISAPDLKDGLLSLEKIMDLVQTTVNLTCSVLHIQEDELTF